MLDNRLKDKWWRLTHLYKIRDKQGRLVTFKPNPIQLRHLAERGAQRYVLITKYRQGGITTLYSIDSLDEALWVSGMTCAIVAHEAKKLPEYFTIIKRAFENLPNEIKPTTKTDTKYMYEFLNRYDGARLDSSIYVAVDIRGGTVRRLHVTESAYIKDRQRLKAATKQAVPLTGYISEETTGNGFNEYYDDYMEALTNPNPGEFDYRAYFYAWVQDPQYTLPGAIDEYTISELKIKEIAKKEYGIDVTDGQLLWRRWKMNELRRNVQGVGLSGEQIFKQEYPLTVAEAFQSGAGNVFDTQKIESISAVEPNRPEVFVYDDTDEGQKIKEKVDRLQKLGVWFWELPKKGKKYDIGVDPSDGEGSDFGPIDVWEHAETEHIQVAQFYGKVHPDELAEIAAELGSLYNKAFVGVENNMLTTILFLSKIYDNYYFETKIDEKSLKKTKKIGWNTNTKTRDPLIDRFIIAFDDDMLVIRSKVTLSEMRTFVKKDNGKREHADGKHDDALFSAMIAYEMRNYDTPKVRVFSTKPF